MAKLKENFLIRERLWSTRDIKQCMLSNWKDNTSFHLGSGFRVLEHALLPYYLPFPCVALRRTQVGCFISMRSLIFLPFFSFPHCQLLQGSFPFSTHLFFPQRLPLPILVPVVSAVNLCSVLCHLALDFLEWFYLLHPSPLYPLLFPIVS